MLSLRQEHDAAIQYGMKGEDVSEKNSRTVSASLHGLFFNSLRQPK
jgi:hypothetical protein